MGESGKSYLLWVYIGVSAFRQFARYSTFDDVVSAVVADPAAAPEDGGGLVVAVVGGVVVVVGGGGGGGGGGGWVFFDGRCWVVVVVVVAEVDDANSDVVGSGLDDVDGSDLDVLPLVVVAEVPGIVLDAGSAGTLLTAKLATAANAVATATPLAANTA
jgi:hypothetical protein